MLQVIAKIPKADAARFKAVLRGTVKEGERRDRIADDFREIIFSGVERYARSTGPAGPRRVCRSR